MPHLPREQGNSNEQEKQPNERPPAQTASGDAKRDEGAAKQAAKDPQQRKPKGRLARRFENWGWNETLQLALVLIGSAYAVLTFLQVKSTKNAVALTKRQFDDSERPYVWVSHFDVPECHQIGQPVTDCQIEVNWHYVNYGKIPAVQLRWHTWTKLGDEEFKSFRIKTSIDERTGAPLPPTEDRYSTAVSEPIPLARFGQLFVAERQIWVKGVINYTDASGRPYETGFCASRLRGTIYMFCDNEPGQPETNYMR